MKLRTLRGEVYTVQSFFWACVKALLFGCFLGLLIGANAIYSCINGDNTANIFFRELAYATHAATPPKTIIASPSKPKPKKSKKVKLCFADNDGVQQCK